VSSPEFLKRSSAITVASFSNELLTSLQHKGGPGIYSRQEVKENQRREQQKSHRSDPFATAQEQRDLKKAIKASTVSTPAPILKLTSSRCLNSRWNSLTTSWMASSAVVSMVMVISSMVCTSSSLTSLFLRSGISNNANYDILQIFEPLPPTSQKRNTLKFTNSLPLSTPGTCAMLSTSFRHLKLRLSRLSSRLTTARISKT